MKILSKVTIRIFVKENTFIVNQLYVTVRYIEGKCLQRVLIMLEYFKHSEINCTVRRKSSFYINLFFIFKQYEGSSISKSIFKFCRGSSAFVI